MFCKAVTLLAIIALAQAKPAGKFASFGTSPKNNKQVEEDSETKPSGKYAKYSLPAGSGLAQSQGVDYDDLKLNKNYADVRPSAEYGGYEDEEYNGHPKYKYTYSVNDENTGDYKSHFEERDGDTVHGEYVVADPDGTVRKVTYTADSKNGFQAVVKTTKNSNPIYETPQAPNKPQNRPETGYTEADYNKYYQQKPVEVDYSKNYQQKPAEGDYNRQYQQKPVEADYNRQYQQKPVETDYNRQYQQKPVETNYNRQYQQKPVEADYTKYYQQKPAEGNRNEKLAESSYTRQAQKTYVTPTIPTETDFKPYQPAETSYKQYAKPQRRHHNLVAELKYQDRLNNHRLSGPGYESEEDTYKSAKGKDATATLPERYNGGYSFRQKAQKDSDGLGSEAVAAYAAPEFEDDYEDASYRYYEE